MINSVSFYGNDTVGNVSTKPQVRYETPVPQTPEGDTVCFQGRGEEKKSSVGKTILKLAVVAAATIGGLAYAHKANWVSKLKDGKIKTHLSKATETCYGWCEKTSKSAQEYYEKVKSYFQKKS